MSVAVPGGATDEADDRPRPVPPAPLLEIAIITGLSGAGRSTAAKCLEDLGWFVVDNLPPGLLATMADLGSRSQGAVERIAAVVDVRGRAFFADLQDALTALETRGVRPRVL
ncbi:MAG: RNase adapter protein RapZ, partial [Frankiaceae bacterium]|nr:RNase adapter protein RapZ [Frankiaceae bacterium]